MSHMFNTTNNQVDMNEGDTSGCGRALIVLSWVLVILTMPFSLFVCFKVSKFKCLKKRRKKKSIRLKSRLYDNLSPITLFSIVYLDLNRSFKNMRELLSSDLVGSSPVVQKDQVK